MSRDPNRNCFDKSASPTVFQWHRTPYRHKQHNPKMPPRINLFTARKAVPVVRSSSTPSARPSILDLQHRSSNATYVGLQKRWNSSSGSDASAGDNNNENPDRLKGPTEDALPHVSEEAAAMDDIMSKEKRCDGIPSSPELEQGTPISEVTLIFYSILFSEEEKQSIDIIFFYYDRSSNATRKPKNTPPRLCRT